MTRVERLEKQLEQLQALKNQAMRQNDYVNFSKCCAKIEEVEKTLNQAKMYEPTLLSEVLDGKGEDVKNHIYKLLLKCSLAADFINDCVFETKEELAKIGISDFHFREDLMKIVELSRKVSAIVVIPGQDILNDMMTDDDSFIDACHAAADAHLKERLNL
jgi:hypothetical protein